MPTVEAFTETQLQAICDVLADTSKGLSGSEIGRFLNDLSIADPFGNLPPFSKSKRERLYEALRVRQQRDGCSNSVVAFIHRVMDPVRYTNNQDRHETRRQELNTVLAFCGLCLGEDGKLRRAIPARTLTEAEERAGRLRAELQRRGVHPDVLMFCKSELLQKNYFHAVFEATKSVADKIRSRTGLTGDGAELVDHAFGIGKASIPFLAFNALQTDTERKEHFGETVATLQSYYPVLARCRVAAA